MERVGFPRLRRCAERSGTDLPLAQVSLALTTSAFRRRGHWVEWWARGDSYGREHYVRRLARSGRSSPSRSSILI
jgi:hypothetical protein